MTKQWGPVGEWVEVPEHPILHGRYRYRRVAHHDGIWHGLEVEQQDRNGRWVVTGKEFGRGFAVGLLVPDGEWPKFAEGPAPQAAP